ncbi:MAG: DNA topoisomerase (ATP-hydrolyzing) subunit A [Acidimicrobiales bacterium]
MCAQIAAEIRDVTASEELGQSFLPYSLSVITSRALPDVRDGLKPVQRRILVTMNGLNLGPNVPHRKSAKVVGDCMGTYHPHGDSAIYDALVRLGQDFSMRVPLVDPHGNFGSLDDPPAASRYTECRMSQAAVELLDALDEDTVEWRDTYDEENQEPEYLPAKLPNLLVNGSAGIAVGMATNMAPHNLVEVVAALKLFLTRGTEPTVEQLMARLPGPDFPTGGVIVDDGGLIDAYRNGRGSIRMRATAEVGQVSARRSGIIVTELPYMVGPERVISRIKELVVSGKITAITDVKNLSDRRSGLKLQIELRSGTNGEAVLAELYRLTPLEESFAINNVALVNGVPTTLGLVELCRYFINHRIDVVVRRTRFRRERALARAHIVEGLLIALDHIEQVIAIIRSSADAAIARQRLQAELTLSEIQATAILDMRLRRLTALERDQLVKELAELRVEIAGYDEILASEAVQKKLVLTELEDLAKRLGTPRRSRLVGGDEMPKSSAADAPTDFELGDDPCVITWSSSGLVGREPAGTHHSGKVGRHDLLRGEVHTSNRALLLAISDRGRLLTIPVHDVPEVAGRSRGAAVAELFAVGSGEKLVGLLELAPEPAADEAAIPAGGGSSDGELPAAGPGLAPLLLVTASGVAKRVSAAELAATKDGQGLIGLDSSDRLVAAWRCPEAAEVALVASDGQILRTATDAIPIQGRAAKGVAGMKLRSGAKVIAAGVIEAGAAALTVTEAGTAKLTALDEVPAQGRATSGVRLTRLKADEGALRYALVAPAAELSVVLGSPVGEDGSDAAGGRADPAPVPLPVAPTRRDGPGQRLTRPIVAAGKARW